MASCTTTSKVNKFVTKNPVYTANLCDSLYPIKTSTDTQYITDSGLLEQYEKEFAVLYAMIDSMTLDSAKIFFKKINALEAQKEKLIEDKDKAVKARKTANNWAMRWLIGFWLLVAWIFRKPIWKFVYKIISPIKF